MFDPRTIPMFLSIILFLQLSSAFYLMEDRYKKQGDTYEEVETITDPVKVKMLMSQPAKEMVKFTPVLIPDKFSRYDSIDHDGHISLKELIRTTGAERNAKNAFQAADKDANGEISQEEFKMAPWAMRPTAEDGKDDKDYTFEDAYGNITHKEVEAKFDKMGRNVDQGEKEREAGKVGGERHKERRKEQLARNEAKKGKDEMKNKSEKVSGVRGEKGERVEEGDQKAIIEKNERDGLEESLNKTEGGDIPKVGERKFGGEEKEITEQKIEGGVKPAIVKEGEGEEEEELTGGVIAVEEKGEMGGVVEVTEKPIVGVNKTLGKGSKVGGEKGKATEKTPVGKVTPGVESKEGGLIEKTTVGGVTKAGTESTKGGERGVTEKTTVGRVTTIEEQSKTVGEPGVTEKIIVEGVIPLKAGSKEGVEGEKTVGNKSIERGDDGKVKAGEVVIEKVGDTVSVRNESIGVGEGKEGESKEEEKVDEEKTEEEKNGADKKVENKDKSQEFIEIEELESHIQHSDADILDPHEFGSILDAIDDQLDEIDHLILEDFENNESIDAEETSGELIETDDNEESYLDEDIFTDEENNESLTD